MIARSDGASFARRLLDEIRDAIHALAELGRGLAGDHAVARDLVHRHALDGEHRSAGAIEHVDHLLQRRRRRVDHIVGKDHGERLVADDGFGDEHGVAEPERLALADVRDVDQVRDLADLVGEVLLAAALEKRLELLRDVEVILDRVLAAAGDDDDVRDAGVAALPRRRTESSACRRAAASPSAAPWWRGESGCRGRRRGRRPYES